MSRTLPACLVVVLLAEVALAAVSKVLTDKGLITIGCQRYGLPCSNKPEDRCCNEGLCVKNICKQNSKHVALSNTCSASMQKCDPASSSKGGCCSDIDHCDCSTDESAFCMCNLKTCVPLELPCSKDHGNCCENLFCNCYDLSSGIQECQCLIHPDHCVPLNSYCGGTDDYCCSGTECQCDESSCVCKQPCIAEYHNCETDPYNCCSGLICRATDDATMKCTVPPPPTTPPPCLTQDDNCNPKNDLCCKNRRWADKTMYGIYVCETPFFGGPAICTNKNRHDFTNNRG